MCHRLLTSAFVLLTGFVVADEPDQRSPTTAVSSFDVADGLEITLMGSEPLLKNPSNIDVDHLGRIWVCEIVNYRHFANKDNPIRETGDRIAVLEDTDGDGILDKDTTFYQGKDIDSAHGVCILGNRVIVSAGANVFDFYDDDGDLKADRKEILFTGIKGVQHDHGIHSFTFGPDGRLYFNFGNSGKELHLPDGSLAVDLAGNEVQANRRPYQEGMAFRCESDGTHIDTLGWNFRNNWELCVDSFGTVWQSDNDDDGNKSVRINYVMEYGNYGYKDELTGAGWRVPRTNMEDTIPEQHWHLNDPGVIPNLLQTGAGSPTGIIVYEGDLLPSIYRNQLIHCDAGPNIIRSYAIKNVGAGYQASINNIVQATRDQWFRPSDVCVAPDGSLIVADWYDPGVGGHRQGDIQRGRIFRIAPNGSKYSVPKHDFNSLKGAIQALTSPNVATRYLAYQKLKSACMKSVPLLTNAIATTTNPRLQARFFWLAADCLATDQAQNEALNSLIDQCIQHNNSDIRITGLRIARRQNRYINQVVERLANDPSPQVRREVAIALRNIKDGQFRSKIWANLATRASAEDRWQIEALGIGADGLWEKCMLATFNAIADSDSSPSEVARQEAAYDRLWWRSRSDASSEEIIARLIAAASQSEAEASQRKHILAGFRSLDFQPKASRANSLITMLTSHTLKDVNPSYYPLVVTQALQRLDKHEIQSNPKLQAQLDLMVEESLGTSQFIQLVQRLELKDRYRDVLTLAQSQPTQQVGIEAIRLLLRQKQWPLLTKALHGTDTQVAIATAEVMGNSRDGAIVGVLLSTIKNEEIDLEVRRAAVKNVVQVQYGAQKLVDLFQKNQLSNSLKHATAAALHNAPSKTVREIAQQLFPLPAAKEGEPLPPMNQLIAMKSQAKNGRLVFHTTGTCYKCHVVGKLGRDIGPNLSEIGDKLSRSAMFEAILYPDAGINHNYQTWTLILANGTSQSGLLVSETDDTLTLKGDDGILRDFQTDEIDEKVKQKVSLMPSNLQKIMTAQEIVDVVGYMQTLRKSADNKQ